MPIGLWHKVIDRFAPARVLEFDASTEGDAVLANVAGKKTGAKGRPLPGSTEIRLGGYDAATGRFIEDEHGFVRLCADDEVGMLLAKSPSRRDAHTCRCAGYSPRETRGSPRTTCFAATATATIGSSTTRTP
jgi:putative long chain acyl-CoA synthase